jgi:hypothetical protein
VVKEKYEPEDEWVWGVNMEHLYGDISQ